MANEMLFPFEKIAMQGGEIPEGLSGPEITAFLQLRLLYANFRAGAIDREAGAREKVKIADVYRSEKFRDDRLQNWFKARNATDFARIEYAKNRTLENADKIVEALESSKL